MICNTYWDAIYIRRHALSNYISTAIQAEKRPPKTISAAVCNCPLAGPCTFGNTEYTNDVIFAGPNQDRFNYTVIDIDTWKDQDKNFTLVLSQS